MRRQVVTGAIVGWVVVALLVFVVLGAAGVDRGLAAVAAVFVGLFMGAGLGMLVSGRLAGPGSR